MTDDKKTETAIVKPKDTEDFVAMEKWDEDQIMRELEGQYMQEFVYSINKGNARAVGLSYAGVKEVQRQMAESGQPISLSELEITESADGRRFMVKVKATNKGTGVEMYGVSAQLKTMATRGGDIEDEFAMQKAVSKAQRNAIRAIIPEKFAALVIAQRLGSTRMPAAALAGFQTANHAAPASPAKATLKQQSYFADLRDRVGEAITEAALKSRGVAEFKELDMARASEVLDELEAIHGAKTGR